MIALPDRLFDFQQYRSILCLDGDLPTAEFFSGCDLPLIAADGALNKLRAMKIIPQWVVGDLDTARPEFVKDSQAILRPDQDSNDFQKCLQFMGEKNLLPAVIIGISGGCLDHILNNVNIFMQTDCLLYAPPIAGFMMQPEKKSLHLRTGTKISLMGFPQAIVSSSGLKWELDKYAMAFPGKNSCFNRTESETVEITVHDGALLVLVYFEKINDAGS